MGGSQTVGMTKFCHLFRGKVIDSVGCTRIPAHRVNSSTTQLSSLPPFQGRSAFHVKHELEHVLDFSIHRTQQSTFPAMPSIQAKMSSYASQHILPDATVM